MIFTGLPYPLARVLVPVEVDREIHRRPQIWLGGFTAVFPTSMKGSRVLIARRRMRIGTTAFGKRRKPREGLETLYSAFYNLCYILDNIQRRSIPPVSLRSRVAALCG